ncbi:hypothetical protein NDU88_007151 [Pleurodeles waltl]|uniref:Uncharacterized protein n=1 Tax=Pleurodeles waltl TaxID=8319 RepID=A0AAV7LR88_PLEWA|nr:hypothetical protein NDU88_007151 [Pleurodeles waltl]
MIARAPLTQLKGGTCSGTMMAWTHLTHMKGGTCSGRDDGQGPPYPAEGRDMFRKDDGLDPPEGRDMFQKG